MDGCCRLVVNWDRVVTCCWNKEGGGGERGDGYGRGMGGISTGRWDGGQVEEIMDEEG